MRKCQLFGLLFLVFASPLWADQPKKLLLLSQGPDGHPPQTHEYVAGQKILQKMLARVPGLETSLARADEPWPQGPELLAKADGAVLFLSEGARWLGRNPQRLQAFQDLARRGGGLSALHWAIGTRDAKNIDPFTTLFGACHGGPDRKYKFLTTKAHLANDQHAILQGIKNITVRDEFYYQLKVAKAGGTFQPLLLADIDGRPEMVAWAWQRSDKGRSFGFSGLHYHDNWRIPEYRRLVLQGVVWTLGISIPPKGLAIDIPERDFQLK